MDKNSNVETYRLQAIYESAFAPTIIMSSTNVEKGNTIEYLTNINGEYAFFQGMVKNQEHELGRIEVKPKMVLPSNTEKKIYYEDFEVCSDAYLKYIQDNPSEDPKTPQQYRNNAALVNFLKTHNQVVWTNEQGKQNPNLKHMSVLYKLTNITDASISKNNMEIQIAKALGTVINWYENSEYQQKYLDYCYLWGINGIERHSKQSLFATVVAEIKGNVRKHLQVLEWLKDEIRIAVHKAIVTTKSGSSDFVIPRDGVYYSFENEPVGENIEQVVSYFNTHEQQYALLKHILNIKEKITVDLPEKVALADKINSKSAEVVEANQEAEIEKFKARIIDRVDRIAEGKNVMIEKVKTRFQLIDNVTYTKESVLASYAATEDVVKYGLQDFLWETAKEKGLVNKG